MKKLLIGVSAAILFAIPVRGQFNTGSSYFSGTTYGKLGLESTTTEFGDNVNVLCIGFTPEAGYFIRNRLALGGLILVDVERTLGEFGSSEHEMVFGPTVRYYLPRDTEMQVFLAGFAGYGFVPAHQVIRLMVGPGINFFLTEKIAFEAKLLYAFSREWNREGGGHHHVHDVAAMAGISLFFSDLTFISRKGALVE